MRGCRSLLVVLGIALPVAGNATLYRWVDERGVVNYSSVRPAGVKNVTQLDEDAGRVSTVPGIPPEQLARQRQLELEARVEQLEREAYERRVRDAMAATAPAYPAYPAYYPGYAAYPTYFPAYGYRFAARVVHRPRVHAVVRHAPVRGMRR